MSETIRIDGEGAESLSRLTAAVNSLDASLKSLTSTNNPLAQMQAQMATGFAALTALVENGGKKVREAKKKADDDLETDEQAYRDRHLNNDRTFNNAVAAIKEKRLELEIAFDREVAKVTGKQAGQRALDHAKEEEVEVKWLAMLETTREKQLALEATFEREISKVNSGLAAQRALDHAKEEEVEIKWLAMLDTTREKQLALEATFEREISKINSGLAAKRALDHAKEEEVEAKWLAMLDTTREKQLALEAAFEREIAKVNSGLAAQRALDHAKEEEVEAAWLAMLAADREKAIALENAFDRAQGEITARRAAAAATAAERNARLNANYLSASPASQAQSQMVAVAATSEGLDAAKLVGTKAAADAAGKSIGELRIMLDGMRGTTRSLAADTEILNGVLKQTEGAFRGAAHEAGIYGLHHGQLIGLLAGGAVAMALHHIAETGAEVEFELANLNALSGQMQPIDINKFVGITSGTLTNIKDAAAGMAALAEAGMDQGKAMAVLPDVMRLASLGNMTVAQSAEMAVESMHAFGKSAADIGNIGDVLVAVGSHANVSVHKLAEDMKSAATTGQLFNLSMEEITATVGTLAERGLTIQPLSSALNKLYEPSAKTAAVMKEWGLTVKDSAGGLKNYTQFMGELAAKVSEFRVPADALKQLGMSSQSIKAMEVMTQHTHEYKELLHEAEHAGGKMFDAMLVKEDTAEGAFKRLASTVDGTFTKAFAQASPYVQSIEEQLLRLAGNQGTIDMFVQFAVGVTKFTQALIDNAGAVGVLIAAFAGLRIISALIGSVQSLAIAYETATAASLAKAAADKAEIERLALLTAEQRAAAIAAKGLGTGSVLAGEGMAVAAVAARTLSSALGIIGIVLTAATLAYELFGNKLNEQEKLRVEANNLTETTIDAYQREIERLKGVEEQLIRTGKAGKETAGIMAMLKAQDAVDEAEKKLKAAAAAPAGRGENGIPGRFGSSARTGDQLKDDAVNVANAELNKAIEIRDKTIEVVQSAEELAKRVQKTLTVTDVQSKLKSFGDTIVPVLKTPAAEAAAKDANERIAKLRAQSFDTLDTPAATNALVEAKKQLEAIEKDILATKRDAAAISKPDKSGLNADLSALQGRLEIQKLLTKSEIDSLTAQNARGEVGDLQMINAQLRERQALNNQAVETARAQYNLVAASDKPAKQAAEQKYKNAQNKSAAQQIADDSAAEEKRLTVMDKYADLELKLAAKTLTDKGDMVGAYLKNFEAQYGKTIAKLVDDMETVSDPEKMAELGQTLLALTRAQTAGTADAGFKQDQQAFSAAMSSAQEQIATAKATAAADGGISGAMGLADASARIRTEMLPGLARMVEEMQRLAVASGNAAQIAEANKAKTSLANITKGLAKDAQPFGDAWAKVWKDVDGYAHSAWMSIGTGGKNAFDQIGKVLKSSILDMLYQLTVKKWLVNIAATASGGGSSALAAAGDVAGAASGSGSALSTIGMASSLSNVASGVSSIYSAVTGAGVTGMSAGGLMGSASGFIGGLTGEAAATSAVMGGAELSGAAALGSSIASGASAVLASIPVWGWAALGAVALYGAFGGGSGPEDHTRIGFTSNNSAGNISINERGNEGRSNTYIGNQGTSSALGTFGVSSSFWAQDQSKTVTDFLKAVSQTDNALASFMTTAEKSQVTASLTGKKITAYTGAEGEDPNKNGELDGVFKQRIHMIMEGLGGDLASMTDNFKGTSQELATEAQKILQFRQALQDGGVAVFGMTTSLQDLAKLAAPSENVSDALTRVTSVFNVTNQIATITGKTTEQMFGKIGIASYDARNNLIQAAGGLTTLSAQVSSYSSNFLNKSQQNAGAMRQVTDVMASLNLSSITTKKAFSNVVSGIDTTTPAGAKLFASLMSVQQAFNDVYSATEGVTSGLQDQLDQLTMTRVELLQKERDALDPANQALYDQIQQQKRLAAAKDAVSAAYDREVTNITAANTRLKTLSDTLRTFAVGLSLGDKSPLSVSQKYDAAKAQMESTVAKAKGGDIKAQDGLQTAIEAFLDASKAANASGGTYSNDFATAQGVANNMSAWVDSQVDIGTASLAALKTQIGGLVDIKDAVQSLPSALADLLGLQAPQGDTKAQVMDVYKQLMGRAPDALTLARLTNDVTYTGKTVASIATDLKNSPEYMAQHIPSAYAYDGAGNTAEALADMAAQITALNAQIAAFRREAHQTGSYIADSNAAVTGAAAQQQADAAMAAARERIYAQKTGVTIQ